MYRIKTFNKISPVGLSRFDPELYSVGDDLTGEDGILVRSAKLQDYEFPDNLLGIARAGVGVNNIPLDRCSQAGIAVFNTPGANANAVKELVLCAMLIGSRDVDGAIRWVRQQVYAGVDVTTVVEKGKSAFIGPEIYKKTLGVIGLGAIGSLVANLALDLGMDVYGYDPFLSVDSALRLDRHIHVVQDIHELYKRADYITIHIHFTPKTEKMINEKAIASMKRGARFINLARGEIVDDDAMLAALDTGKVATYVTDFPNNRIVQAPHVIAMPHLGASTPESEQNCAVMAVDQLRDYLENGNIRNSVNLPNVTLERSGVMRMCIIHKNIPAMLASITTLLAKDRVNV
ncbi:MAG: 3-phosphoglycerate dehydrogenase, partial [Oscillospiraceae bacterium]|nr:3-phosphoglycerate dehydrogenase [Oscillospiraceae bacterium]